MTHITRVFALTLVILFACSAGLAACAPANEAVLAVTSEQSSSATAIPSLTKEQKANMVWIGKDFQACYPMEVFVFYGNIDGKNRLIWTYLEDKQSKRTYSFYEPFSATELIAYDLINREYLFTLSFSQDSLQTDAGSFYRYITDLSPELVNSTFSSSESLLNLEALYDMAGINNTEVQNFDSLINGFIYVEPNTIGSWEKSRAVEAYCAATPEDYLLPFWEYIPNTVKPENLDSISPFSTPALKTELTVSEIISIFNIQNPEERVPVNTILFIYYTIPNQITGESELPQIAFLTAYSAYDNQGDEVLATRSLWDEKDVFTIKEIGEYYEYYLDNSDPFIVNTKFNSLSPKILFFSGPANLFNLDSIFNDCGEILNRSSEEYAQFSRTFLNFKSSMETHMSKIDIARMFLGCINYDTLAKADSFN